MRRRISILIAMPIAAIGSLVAHQVSYLLSAPDVGLRARLLAATGHGYLRWAPMIVGVVGVTLLVGLLVEAHRSGRARSVGFPAWSVALVAPLAFAMQEHVERLLHVGAFPTGLLASRSFLTGLLLQVPFGLLSWGIACVLGRAARAAGTLLRRTRRARPIRPATVAPMPTAPVLVRRGSSDPVRVLRAPPAFALAVH